MRASSDAKHCHNNKTNIKLKNGMSQAHKLQKSFDMKASIFKITRRIAKAPECIYFLYSFIGFRLTNKCQYTAITTKQTSNNKLAYRKGHKFQNLFVVMAFFTKILRRIAKSVVYMYLSIHIRMFLLNKQILVDNESPLNPACLHARHATGHPPCGAAT